MTNAALTENSSDQSFIQSAKQVLGKSANLAFEDGANLSLEKSASSASMAPLNDEDLTFIHTHGTRKYAEELQKKIVDEIRQELMNLMGLTNESLADISELQRQTIEGLIAVEIDARLNASLAADEEESGANSAYLNAMILSQGNYGTFDEQPITSLDDFKKQAAARS